MNTEKESLLTTLKDDYVCALVDRDTLKKDVLSTFIGSVKTYEKAGKTIKEITDAVVYKLLQDRINQYNETIDQLKGIGRDSSSQERERDVLQQYMPTQMNEEALKKVIEDIYSSLGVTGKKAIGKIVEALKKDYAGQYDAATAMKIINPLVDG